MTEDVGGLSLLEIRFDENGDVDPAGETEVRSELERINPTDLVVFSHGWNNAVDTAHRLYQAFFGELAPLVAQHAPSRKVALLGVYWPSQRWSDEPIPDFAPAAAPAAGDGGGAASFGPGEEFPPPPPPDAQTAAAVRDAFPDNRTEVDELLALLVQRPDDRASLARARALIGALAGVSLAEPVDDGEAADRKPFIAENDPDVALFDSFALQLENLNVVTDDGAQGGQAGLGDNLKRLWHGAQEAARQLTYWQMKKRAGVVGEKGLGPFLARLLEARPGLGLHLVGHSFGARVVSFSLKGLPEQVNGVAPVRGVTLLQGAFSHFSFASGLPFDANRSGALSGQQSKVAGPIVACFSQFDSAVGTFYPLASFLGREDAAAFDDVSYRWGGMGHDGHQKGVPTIDLLNTGDAYSFAGDKLVNINAARVVNRGGPPSGAHSDIVHPELAWVVLSAGGLLD